MTPHSHSSHGLDIPSPKRGIRKMRWIRLLDLSNKASKSSNASSSIVRKGGQVFALIFLVAFSIAYIRFKYEDEWLMMSFFTGLIYALPATIIYALWEFSWAILDRSKPRPLSASSLHNTPDDTSVAPEESVALQASKMPEQGVSWLKSNSWLMIIPVLLIAPFAKELGRDFANWLYPAESSVSHEIQLSDVKYIVTAKNETLLREKIDQLVAYDLGSAYWEGRGVPQDYVKSVGYLRKAPDFYLAQYLLGMAYRLGYGVMQDHVKFIEWTRKAAEWRYAPAQSDLGQAYLLGQGVPQDYAKAVEWYRKAAEQGYAPAQANLGRAYFTGRGVPMDFVQSYMWLNLSAAQGDSSAIKTRDSLFSIMTSQEIAEGQRLTREWLAKNPNLLNGTR